MPTSTKEANEFEPVVSKSDVEEETFVYHDDQVVNVWVDDDGVTTASIDADMGFSNLQIERLEKSEWGLSAALPSGKENSVRIRVKLSQD